MDSLFVQIQHCINGARANNKKVVILPFMLSRKIARFGYKYTKEGKEALDKIELLGYHSDVTRNGVEISWE